MYRSQKDINNVATNIHVKDTYNIFMSIDNQLYNIKKIYLLHKQNSGNLIYLYFRMVVPLKMSKWVEKYKNTYVTSLYMLAYLNHNFIKSCFDLYEYKSNTGELLAPIVPNVYRSTASLGEYNNGAVNITEKKYGDLMANDYGSVDVWAEQTTEVNLADDRHKNLARIQKSMSTRSYDRENEGYRATVNHSSLYNITNGYKFDMNDLTAKKLEKYQKNNSDIN